MDIERAMEFQLEQAAASQARFDAQMTEIRATLAATAELGRARAERRGRKEADDRLAASQEQLRQSQEELRQSLKSFIDSMRQGGNGHNKT